MSHELNPRYTFETFFVGEAASLAASAGRSVAESPGDSYNPLVIHGPPGCGKTHLLMAVGALAMEKDANARVEYLTAQDFAEGLMATSGSPESSAYRNRFADVTVLLLDDVHRIQGLGDVQGELTLLMRELMESGGQIVMASELAPGSMDLNSRGFKDITTAGMVVELGAPGLQSRVNILRNKAIDRGIDVAEGALEAIAESETGNMRVMIGNLNKVLAFESLSGRHLDRATVADVLAGRTSAPFRDATPEDVPETETPSEDEFSSFLSGVSAQVSEEIERFSGTLKDQLQELKQEGYSLEGLGEVPSDPAEQGEYVKRAREAVERLKVLQQESGSVDPFAASDPVFKDVARVDEAETVLADLKEHGPVEITPPSEGWVFDSFIEGSHNAQALEAAKSVAEGREKRLLLICGGRGVGKSHLIHAVGNAIIESGGPVTCLTGSELMEIVKQWGVSAAVRRWRRLNAVCIDNLNDRDEVLDDALIRELLPRLADEKVAVVAGVEVGADQMDPVSTALKATFEGSRVEVMSAPARDFAVSFVRGLLESDSGSEPDADLVNYVADRAGQSIRSMASEVARLLQHAADNGQELDISVARSVMEGLKDGERPSAAAKVAAARSSGVVLSPLGGLKSREKMVWSWHHVSDRAIEDPS